jgi:hypothetical protein
MRIRNERIKEEAISYKKNRNYAIMKGNRKRSRFKI